MSKNFKITLKRGLIGCTKSQRLTIEALGLKKRGSVIVKSDTPATRGQILKVQHLLDVQVGK